MNTAYTTSIFPKVLVPVVYGCHYLDALAAARSIAGEGQVILAGFVKTPVMQSLSTAALAAREVRLSLQELAQEANIHLLRRICVSHRPWDDLFELIEDKQPDLLVLEWNCHLEALGATLADALAHLPCDIALVCGTFPPVPQSVLVSLRGGPYAELALRLSLAVSQTCRSQVTALHLAHPEDTPVMDLPFQGLELILENLPEVARLEMTTPDRAKTILEVSRAYDLLVMGATGQLPLPGVSIGPVVQQVLDEGQTSMIIVKTRQPYPAEAASEAVGQTAISVLVDKWFAENTYHADEFDDLQHLAALKRNQGLTISLALPALNEERTIGDVIQTIKGALVEPVPLLDEIIVVDSNSADRTRQIAGELGIPVYIHQETLPTYGARRGKGEALWKSLYLSRGDILVWIDTDIANIHPRFVYGLLGPLLLRPDIQFVKGFYRRPLKLGEKVQAGGGGRVTELTARPLLNLFYPELSGLVQPLSGEYGGRRSALEKLPFFSGYGVEIGLLIDVFEKFGLSAIAQVDLLERVHHNQSLESLSKMSFAIIQAVINRLEQRYRWNVLKDVNKTMKLIRYEPGRLFLDVEEIAELERPPMIELPEYRSLYST